ncbi:MAG: alkaline phosphatase [Saprospiraceae bacterium]|nr:alkaline phosphatase [Saprospiraceae bacterium]
MHNFFLCIYFISLSSGDSYHPSQSNAGPFFATGIKIGEVSQNRALIWTRLTKNQERIYDAVKPDVKYFDVESGKLESRKGRPNKTPIVTFPDGHTINNIEGATPGSAGLVQLKYRRAVDEAWLETSWQEVDKTTGFTSQFTLEKLKAGTKYLIVAQSRAPGSAQIGASIEGSFTTAPEVDQAKDVKFIVTTGTSYNDVDSEQGYLLYPSALNLEPDFFVHTGDILYYDGYGKSLALARWHWDRMYSFPNHIDFHRQVPSYFIKDDHDTWMNDCYPGMQTKFMGAFTYEQGTALFLEQVPMGHKTYRTFQWGRDLQIWLMEGRDFRSPNPMPDGPDKTIWGLEQMAWFKETVSLSTATFKVIISPTPIVGPDRGKKNDNHANIGFYHEGHQIREFLADQNNTVVVCGDRHWQYISKDRETGLLEFSCGPGADDHAGGWKQENVLPEHLYLNVVGGFLEGSTTNDGEKVQLTFKHYSPKGQMLHEFTVDAKP